MLVPWIVLLALTARAVAWLAWSVWAYAD